METDEHTNLAHPLDKTNQRPTITLIGQTVAGWDPHKNTNEELDTSIYTYNNLIQSENNLVPILFTLFLESFPEFRHGEIYVTSD